MKYLAVFFIAIPIVEMAVLIKVGGAIGILPTILAVILTAMLGLSLLRAQGLSAILRAQRTLRSGALPLKELVEGVFLAVGGALLLTPGFVTDALGFCCLVPGIRGLIVGKVLVLVNARHVDIGRNAGGGSALEGEFTREKD